MKSSVILGLAAGVLAAPSANLAGPVRPIVGGPHRVAKHPDTGAVISNNWAGGVQEGRGWKSVTAETTIPIIRGQSRNAGAAGWVGIDGADCHSAILQTGVQALGDGTVSAWYEWWPNPPVYYGSRFPVKGGDRLRMTVNATSATSGSSTLENLTTGKRVNTPYSNMRDRLCLTDAEWIIELGGGAGSLANFGTWTFEKASATGSAGTVTPEGAEIWDIAENGQQQTDCSADASGVTCKHR